MSLVTVSVMEYEAESDIRAVAVQKSLSFSLAKIIVIIQDIRTVICNQGHPSVISSIVFFLWRWKDYSF